MSVLTSIVREVSVAGKIHAQNSTLRSASILRFLPLSSRTFDVSPGDIRGAKRNGPISGARQAAMYIIREITGLPMSDIGAEFGGRNHSTVVYSNELYRKKIEEDPRLKEITEDIIRNIKEQ